MRKLMVLIISVVMLISCSKDDVHNPSGLKIRLSNVSPYNYQNIVVNTSTGNVNFENLESGQKTDYKVFEKAYRYSFVELQIADKTYTIQPIDYVGETPLETGNYTYQIKANDSEDRYTRLSLTLIEE